MYYVVLKREANQASWKFVGFVVGAIHMYPIQRVLASNRVIVVMCGGHVASCIAHSKISIFIISGRYVSLLASCCIQKNLLTLFFYVYI